MTRNNRCARRFFYSFPASLVGRIPAENGKDCAADLDAQGRNLMQRIIESSDVASRDDVAELPVAAVASL